MSELLNVEEVAKILDKPVPTIKRYARESLLSSTKKGKDFFFNREEVFRYLEISKKSIN